MYNVQSTVPKTNPLGLKKLHLPLRENSTQWG